ncbi:hypothetical protein Sango_1036700 [Sesamum angolense]|uniref:Zinc finger PMZ-type domain-containing protein n=1 Tax=Sesamum angolense TaxID=2727404 RepID=A0AAE1X0H1_9LAMI|nr:hypothetical protein Sango_1036700 [Sesamum angolense]
MTKVLDCITLKADDYHYEIMCFDDSRLSVDLTRYSCACRRWDLTRIPYKHAFSAILSKVHDPEDYVHQSYKVETLLRVYGPIIQPVNDFELWEKTAYIPPLPPSFGRGVGRLPKARRREDDELVTIGRSVVEVETGGSIAEVGGLVVEVEARGSFADLEGSVVEAKSELIAEAKLETMAHKQPVPIPLGLRAPRGSKSKDKLPMAPKDPTNKF